MGRGIVKRILLLSTDRTCNSLSTSVSKIYPVRAQGVIEFLSDPFQMFLPSSQKYLMLIIKISVLKVVMSSTHAHLKQATSYTNSVVVLEYIETRKIKLQAFCIHV